MTTITKDETSINTLCVNYFLTDKRKEETPNISQKIKINSYSLCNEFKYHDYGIYRNFLLLTSKYVRIIEITLNVRSFGFLE